MNDQDTSQLNRKLRIGNRAIQATAAFDSYWRFAHERQALFLRRVAGESPPWTTDPIIAAHRFTNVYRASDRVSQYLIRNVIYSGEQTAEEIFFRTMLFKLFNRIETWERLKTALGELTWKTYDFKQYNLQLDKLFSSGQTVYSGAYIMPSPSFGNHRKHSNHLRLIEYMMHDGAPQKVTDAKSLEGIFKLLRNYPSLGDFLAFQFTIDLNYSPMTDLNLSEMDFVVAGPGARDGIKKCFGDIGGLSEQDVIKFVADIADSEFCRLGLDFQSLWGRSPQLIDYQNVFCELSKYARVAHPEIEGTSGRTRIKQKYKLTSQEIPQWYPPKWGLNGLIGSGTKAHTQSKIDFMQPSHQSFSHGCPAPTQSR